MCLKDNKDQGLSREERLLTAGQYRQVMGQPQNKHHTRAFLILSKTNDAAIARLGMAISKKCNKRAVVRNRIKRLIRESFRHNKQYLTGIDAVVIGKKGIDTLSNEQLRQLLDKAWQHIAKKQ